MPPPEVHYQFSLGACSQGKHSWIIKSAKGITWNNIPEELENILKKLKVQDLIDLELGSDDRYFVRYRDKDKQRRVFSNALWLELSLEALSGVDRLFLGSGSIHWGIRKDATGSFHEFRSEPGPGNDSFGKRMQRRVELSKSCTDIDSVALGFNGDWAICAQGRVEYRSGSLFKDQLKAGWRNEKKVSSVTMSPIARQWLIIYDDGSTSHSLPNDIASEVDDYCQIQHSLISSRRPDIAPTITRLLSRPSPPPRPHTTLRLISPNKPEDMKEYKQVFMLFINGWKHPHKKRPPINRIFAVDLADELSNSYQAYKSLLDRTNTPAGANEKLVFHGTPRYCYLGDGDAMNDLCDTSICGLCGILRNSFSVARAGTALGRNFLRFGHGIYTSSVSSKADDYTNKLAHSTNKVLIVAKVALGKGSIFHRTTTSLRSPPEGYHSVLGEVGVDLNYDEQVLYQDDAVRPAYVILYDHPAPPDPPAQTTSSSSSCTIM